MFKINFQKMFSLPFRDPGEAGLVREALPGGGRSEEENIQQGAHPSGQPPPQPDDPQPEELEEFAARMGAAAGSHADGLAKETRTLNKHGIHAVRMSPGDSYRGLVEAIPPTQRPEETEPRRPTRS